MKKSDITAIVIHCSATREGQDVKIEDITRWHLEQGYKDIGYHYVIELDGTVQPGRPLSEAGAHCREQGYNHRSIGICYVGGLDRNGKAKDTRTMAQRKAMHELVYNLMDLYPITEVIGHRDASPDLNGDGKITKNEWVKECPCFDVKEEFPIAVITAQRP